MSADRFKLVMGNIWVIAALLAVITFLHLDIWTSVLGEHEVLRRLYYIPIILAAFRYGLTGGLITSLLAGLLYAPHLLLYVGKADILIINQLMEILLFVTLGVITGGLSDIQMKQQAELGHQLDQVKRLEREIRIADRLAAVGQLASGVAHEIRNPLGIIKAAAQLAKSDSTDNSDTLESIEVIIKEVDRANRVVTQLLDFAKPRVPKFINVNIVKLLEEVAFLSSQYASQHGVALHTDMTPGNICIEADPEQIKQALINLFFNAVQATPPEGTITARIYPAAGKNGREGIIIEIIDTGIGISAEQIPRIFDPFYTSKEKGVGLGLSIVYSIIQDHGGYINIDSQEGEGTTVAVWLPRANKEG